MTARPDGAERAFVAILKERLEAGRPRARIDLGDDAAALAWGCGDVVASVDAAVEDVHFQRAWLSLDRIAARAFAAALSDLAAMGSEPRGALVALGLPSGTTASEVEALADGLARASAAHGCPVVGGNLTRARELSITTTVLGAGERHLTRGGATAGDGIFVSGVLGACALGLAVLRAGERDRAGEAFVERFASPAPRIALGRALIGKATSVIDVSDGLLADLGHVLEASGVGAELVLSSLPILEDAERVASLVGESVVELALRGGEDYELLFTLPSGTDTPDGTTRIGTIVTGCGVVLVSADGSRAPAAVRGHDHFG